ncbi:MAG: DJ-1/PfpI family protein [Alphaproteobacteria bacterium]|nr:DJ-1/PfpI family protein [Alphaproteobacteria bacterium]MBV9203229.1 DJ-1/PfpI family protein [Alphaproteobacteria bacterium]
MSEAKSFRSGLLVFPNLTQLDLTGPYEVLARLPGAETLLLWKSLDPVRSEHGLTIQPMATLASCPPLDLILVPGGAGINPLLEDTEVLDFLRRTAREARCVVGVCTGSLILGAAGLLRGRRAGTHWMSRDMLRAFGAEPVAERVVIDGNLFTGGGVTAGIDVALTVAAEIAGSEVAQAIQLGIEYDPAPPFASGSPERADPAILKAVIARAEPRQRDRAERVARAAAAL